jgi:sensor histidine kinase YesM
MLARLGDFLRMTLQNSGAQRVALQEELEFLRCYLEIEQVRFQDRLTVSFDVAPDALDALVPNLILQPIVENAIRHGVVTQSGPGRIEISASRSNGNLVLAVRDNGPGLAAAQDSAGKLRGGVGLSNTRARLEHLYGAAQHFEMADARGGGLQVRLEIPFEEAALIHASEKVAAG